MISRIKKVRELLFNRKIDAVLIYKPENRRYFSGFTGTTGFIIITKNEAKFITDFRYIEQAQNQCKDFEIVEISKSKTLINVIEKLDIGTLGIEEEYFTYGNALDFQSRLKEITLVKLDSALTKIRAVKEEEELKAISQAAEITDKGFKYILNYIKPGVSEKDIALELEFFMRKQGASSASFNFIVASGERSSLPHGVASSKLIEKGDFVTLDFGCIYDGYCSDMTRTVVVGKADDRQKKIYDIVLKTQITALETVKPGITGKELDTIARQIIKENGYEEYFGHGLGHGVGLEIHELPHISPIGNEALEPGMVITIEPGIYLPGYGGVRIEDLVVVTDNGYRVLSNTPKELIEI